MVLKQSNLSKWFSGCTVDVLDIDWCGFSGWGWVAEFFLEEFILLVWFSYIQYKTCSFQELTGWPVEKYRNCSKILRTLIYHNFFPFFNTVVEWVCSYLNIRPVQELILVDWIVILISLYRGMFFKYEIKCRIRKGNILEESSQ